MNEPLISVILPVYNGAFSVEETIKSITSQNYRKIELICVDDGSNDNSASKIKKLQNTDKRIQLLQFSKNSGISNALNCGIKNAKGKFIARIDSDDLAETNRLEIQKQFLDQNPQGCNCRFMDRVIRQKEKMYGITDRQVIRSVFTSIQNKWIPTQFNSFAEKKFSKNTHTILIMMALKTRNYGVELLRRILTSNLLTSRKF